MLLLIHDPQNHLSPDFHPARPPPNPAPLERGMSASNPPADSSLNAPHLKQLERLAKLWAPQFPAEQYQSPGRTSDPLNPNEELPLPPKLPKSPLSPDLESPHRWHESRRLKFRCWQDLQFQSPGLLIFFVSTNKGRAKTRCKFAWFPVQSGIGLTSRIHVKIGMESIPPCIKFQIHRIPFLNNSKV